MTGFTLGTTDGATLGTTSGGTLGDTNPDSTFFQVTRDGTTIEDAVFDVDPVVDTANPFGDYCVVKMDDRGGVKFDQYPRGTRLDVGVMLPGATQTIELFTGYVVERRETEQQGADVLEVEAYTFDQFLRRNTVTNDQTGNLISEALADIIATDTPVSYVWERRYRVSWECWHRNTRRGRPIESPERHHLHRHHGNTPSGEGHP